MEFDDDIQQLKEYVEREEKKKISGEVKIPLSGDPPVVPTKDEPPPKKRGRPKKPPAEGIQLLERIFEKPGLILSVGKSEQGKSYLVRYLLSYGLTCGKLKFGLIFQGSKGMNDDYESFLPAKCVRKGFDEDVLKKWVDQLTAHKEKLAKEGKGKDMPRSFIIFDDLLGQLQRSKYVDNFFSLYRHLGITVFLNTQYLATAASSTLVRQQTSFGFFFRSNASTTREALWSWFGGLLEDKKSFIKIYKNATAEDFHCLLFIASENNPRRNYLSFSAPSGFEPPKITF